MLAAVGRDDLLDLPTVRTDLRYLLTAGAVAAVITAAGTEILADDLQIVVFLNHPT
jgi:hypothetical protein